MSGTPPYLFGPYSDEVIDQYDPTHLEFYDTFGRVDVTNNNPPAADRDVAVPSLSVNPELTAHPYPSQLLNPTTLHTVTEQVISDATDPNIAESNVPPIEVQFSLAMHAAALGVTLEELTEILATTPDDAQEELTEILATTGDATEQEIDLNYQSDNIFEDHSASTDTVDPRSLMLWPYHSDLPNNQPESAVHQRAALAAQAPTVTESEPQLSARALRAQRRIRRQELAENRHQ